MASEPSTSKVTELPLNVETLRTNYERNAVSLVSLGLTLISFGFTIYTFFERQLPAGRPEHLIGPREFAVAMIAIGLATLIVAAVQNRRQMQGLRRVYGRPAVPPSAAGMIGALVFLLGVLAIVLVIVRA